MSTIVSSPFNYYIFHSDVGSRVFARENVVQRSFPTAGADPRLAGFRRSALGGKPLRVTRTLLETDMKTVNKTRPVYYQMQYDQIQDTMRDQPILWARGRLLLGSYLRSKQRGLLFLGSLAGQGFDVVIPRAFQIIQSAGGELPRPQSWLLLPESAEGKVLGLE